MNRRHALELVRFVIVGGWNTVLGYGVFAAANYLLADRIPHAYLLASVIANIVAISMAYLGHKFITFRTRGNYLREYLRFYVVYGAVALVNLALLPPAVALIGLLVRRVSWVPYLAQAALLPVNVALSYIGHKRFSFRPRPGSAGDPGAK
jgi:putative flippase GtrA